MENDNLKIQLDNIQRILSYCITQAYNVLIGNILRKKSCISNIQFKEILQKEYIRITDELSSIYLNYPTLACVEEYYNYDDFLWESTGTTLEEYFQVRVTETKFNFSTSIYKENSSSVPRVGYKLHFVWQHLGDRGYQALNRGFESL